MNLISVVIVPHESDLYYKTCSFISIMWLPFVHVQYIGRAEKRIRSIYKL